MEQQNKQIEAMKHQHTKEIEKLLEKVGNTTNIENQQTCCIMSLILIALLKTITIHFYKRTKFLKERILT